MGGRFVLAKRWLIASVVAALGLLVVATTVQAAVFIDQPTIARDDVIDDDVFIAGDSVVIDGVVEGNLFATGAQVVINGAVGGSLVVSGQAVHINGEVGGSVFAGGASVTLGPSARIERNVFAAGYAVEMQREAAVGKDLFVAGYQAIVDGDIERDLRAGVGALRLDGSVGGDVHVDVGDPSEDAPSTTFWSPPGVARTLAPGLSVGPDARIGGRLTYVSGSDQSEAIAIEPGAGVEHRLPDTDAGRRRRPEPAPWTARAILLGIGRWILARVREFVTLLLLGALALWLGPKLWAQTTEMLHRRPWPSLGWGTLAWVGGYVAAGIAAGLILVAALVLGLITLGGLAWFVAGTGYSALGLAFVLFVLLVRYGSKLVVTLLIGQLIVQAVVKDYPKVSFGPDGERLEALPDWKWSPVSRRQIGPFLLGLAIYVFLRGIPVLGWLVGLAATLFGLGAMALRLRVSMPGAVRGAQAES